MGGPLISHVGIAVVDLEAAIARFELLLGCKPVFVKEVADQQVKVAMFTTGGSGSEEYGGRIELVAGAGPQSPLCRFIEKRGEGLHHICVYVDDLESKLSQLSESGVALIDPTPRVGAEGRRVAFVHPRGLNGVLVELEERPG